MFISLYEPFSEQDYTNDDNHATIINCLVHLLSIDKIDVRGFEMWFKDGHVGGDIAWGISDWDEYMAEDHNIHEKLMDIYSILMLMSMVIYQEERIKKY